MTQGSVCVCVLSMSSVEAQVLVYHFMGLGGYFTLRRHREECVKERERGTRWDSSNESSRMAQTDLMLLLYRLFCFV